jgi:hypothetical protein
MDRPLGLRRPRWCAGLLLAALLILSGCDDDTGLASDAQFQPGTTGQGLIVVGWRVLEKPLGRDWISGDTYDLSSIYLLDFARVSLAGTLARPRSRILMCSPDEAFLKGHFGACTPEIMQYRVVAVPAGRYVLTDFAFQSRHLVGVTRFTTTDPRPKYGPIFWSFGDPVAHPDRSFTVGVGEIVYVGDLSFDASVLPARLYITRNDGAAQFALDRYPAVNGVMLDRPIFGTAP